MSPSNPEILDADNNKIDLAKRYDTTITTLINAVRIDDDPTSYNSAAIDCEIKNKFLLFLNIDSTLSPTTLQIIVQFSDDGGDTWYDYKNDFFGDLLYEDTEVASGVKHCVSGECIGSTMRVRAVGVGTNSTNYICQQEP
jgi:hypothetical protein